MDVISNSIPLVTVITSLTSNATAKATGKNQAGSPAAGDSAPASVLDKWLKAAEQGAELLNGSRKFMSQLQNNLVAQKIAFIKAQIRILQTTGGDPRTVAHQIAQLSRELSMAVREYASSLGGGSVSQGGVTVTVTESAAQATSTDNAGGTANGDGTTAAARGDTTTTAVESTMVSETAVSITTVQPAHPDSAQQSGDGVKVRQMDVWQAKRGEFTGSSADANAVQGFKQEIRDIINQLKALAGQQKQRLHKAGDLSAAGYLDQANQSFSEIENDLSNISTASMPAASADSVDVFA